MYCVKPANIIFQIDIDRYLYKVILIQKQPLLFEIDKFSLVYDGFKNSLDYEKLEKRKILFTSEVRKYLSQVSLVS